MGSWLLLSLALAQDVEPATVTLPEADYRAYVRDSRQLDACRARYDGALVQLGEEQARSLALHAQVGACLDRSREDDAVLVAQVDALTEALERSERRRGRLRTAGAVVLGVVAGLVAGLAVR